MAYSNAGPFVLHSFWGDGAVLAGDGVGGAGLGCPLGCPGAPPRRINCRCPLAKKNENKQINKMCKTIGLGVRIGNYS